jgi:hypothetical protein
MSAVESVIKQVNSVKLWFRFEYREENDFEDQSVVSCHQGKLFQHSEGRNVWGPRPDPFFSFGFGGGGNWSNTYDRDESFSFDLETTRKKILLHRKQGSQWVIDELPVIVISGETDSLIVGEINTDEPLSDFLPLRKKLLTLEAYGIHFGPHKQDSVVRIVCRSGSIPPAKVPFYSYRSENHSGRLRFKRSVSEQNLAPVLRVISRINESLQHEARRAGGTA